MAYTTCTVGTVSRGDDGGVQSITLVFTGDAAETPRKFEHTPGAGTKAEELLRAQQRRDAILLELNNKKALATAGGLEPGLVITAAPVAGGPSADALAAAAWRLKLTQYQALAVLGTIPNGALATQFAALKTAINDDFNAASGALKTLMAAAL